MNFLSVETLTKSFGERVLFEDISFGVSEGQKVALIAANGAGKTTLLNILKGTEIADSGKVTFRQGVSVGMLTQNPGFKDGESVLDALFNANSPVLQAVKEYEEAMATHADERRMQHALEQMDALNAWDYEARVKQILGKLGIHDFEQKVENLSGGQQKRLALARLLIEEPQFLILDEPTNHLDLDMIEWLEGYLIGLNKTLLMVTHDRYFLDSVCIEIVEIDNRQMYRYQGNYSYYLEKKADREQIFNSEVDKARNLYKRELDWMRKQPRARGTKQKARIDSFYETEAKAKQTRVQDKIHLAVNMTRLGGKILELNNVSKAYGDKVLLKKFDYVFRRGERIGIVGVNGAGKSTFLQMIMGETPLDKGMIETGETVVFGYYSQKGLQLKEDKRVIEVVKDIAEYIPVGDGQMLTASQFLQHFLFSPDKQYTYVSKLSGGELRRLYLLTILMKNPNFLILDEPTNDLDLPTLGLLEDFLEKYQGCLLVVTHDRYFMDRLVDHLFIFEGEGVLGDFNGTYSEYRQLQQEKEQQAKRGVEKQLLQQPVAINPNVSVPSKKKSFKEQRELELIEKELTELEKQKEGVIAKMSTGNGTHDELSAWALQIEQLIQQIDDKTLRWLELSEG